ncbi:hypothetical protein BDY19DRAFT_907353 [Irpex rosettiformis]|uniref:Uncharacterized protein n=1 Tax=Irpex rosettiformis TaxID=378272 RepID=A0ACB8TZQ0_9APHY|nr:hypothetical protein BDY19DRAFT_907353 [Irpex rosettiformis]
MRDFARCKFRAGLPILKSFWAFRKWEFQRKWAKQQPQTRTCQIRHLPTSSSSKNVAFSRISLICSSSSTMQSDVEMLPEDPGSSSTPVVAEHPPTPTRHRSPIVVEDSSVPPSPSALEHSHTSAAPSSSGIDEGASVAATEKKKNKSSASRPPSTSGAKSKSSKLGPPRSPSPSPPPPLVRPPLQTVRLDIALGGPENYEVNIAALAKETGQRPPTPTPAAKRHDTSDDSHSEGDDEAEGQPKLKKRRKKKNAAQEYYDVTDPFIDDSELAVDERTFFAQTKQQGFYVSSGQVALLTDKSVGKKPKSRKVNIMAPAASVSAALSQAQLPLSLAPLSISNSSKPKDERGQDSPVVHPPDAGDIQNGESTSALKRKSSEGGESVMAGGSLSAVSGGSKKKRKVEIQPFHPELEEAIEELKGAISKGEYAIYLLDGYPEQWDTKGKFPPNIKPLLAQVALKAIILGEYDDNFFNLMPRIFPYNRFTMFKLIKRTVWRQHTDLLLERQNALIEELRKLSEEGFAKAQEDWKRSVSLWEKRHAKDAEGGEPGAEGPSQEGTPAPSDNQPTPNAQTAPLPSRTAADDGGNDTGMEMDDPQGLSAFYNGKGSAFAARDANPPQKKFRLTDRMKEIIWQLVCISNECCRLENEKNQLENNQQVVSDQGVRKTLYQKIVAAFPDGWLTSGQISREVSVMKKKYEKESAENE